MSTAVAKVAFLQGQAWAKAPDGTLRALTVGSTLNDDDILVTAQGSRVELDVGNGEPLIVNGGLEVGMSRDFLADTATEADEALLSDASVQEALTVLEQGGDLLEELEETAAGDNAGGDSDDGNSFVRLARIVEGTGSQSFGYDSAAPNAADTPENDGDYINRAPLVTDQTLASNEDEVLTGQIIASDIEGDSITYALTSAPANGTLLLDPITGQFTFTPNANYNGSDSFVVTVTDSRGNASTTTISLNILPVNDAPTTNDINLTTDEDVPVNGQVVAEDIEGDTLTYAVSAQPTNGTVVLDPATGTFVYTPNSDYNGSDVFIVTVDDGNGGTTTSTVRIGINPVNDAPVSNDQNLVTDEDTPIDGQVVATDVDGDTLSYSVSGQPTNGVVVLNPATGGFTYTPSANYNGSDSFVVTIDDGNGGTTTSRVNIGINPVNDAPESADQNLTTPEDTPLNGQVVATDVENDTLAYAVSGQPTNGSVTLNPATGEFVYTPNANYNGSDSFVVTIDDGNGGTTTSRINIGVTPVNDAPVSSNLNLTTPEDTPISSQISASDVDGDSLTFTVTGAPGNGSVSLNPATGSFTYSPNANYNGSDSFVITISDGNGGTTTSLVNIGVTPVNDAPVASNLNLTTDEGVPVNGAISASDPDGDTLSYSILSAPANGGVSLNAATGTFTYTPGAAFSGNDSFVVRVSDGNGGVTTSTVSIGVAPAPATTVTSIDSPSITEGGDLEFTVTLSGPAVSGTSLAYSLGGGTADAADYGTASFSNGVTLVGGNLIVPTGVSSFIVTVPTVNDVISESTETLPLSVGGVTGTGSILDNDPVPKILSIGVSHATEGADLVCTVTFDQVLAAPYSLSYNIGGGTASLADYGTPVFSNGVTIVGGNLLIPAGINSFSVTLPTVDDSIDEPTETVPFTFGGLTLLGNIYDNDAAPSVSIDSVSINEAAGTATFTVTLSAASGQAISVDYASSDGSATAGSDYTAVSGTLNFAAGETSKTITVDIADDSLFENSENFTITLSNPSNAVLGTAVGIGTIVDNDSAPTVTSISSPSVTEGGDLVYSVTLSGVSATDTSFVYSLGGGSAVAADIGTPSFSDGVTLVGGNLLIPAGVTSFTVTVPTVDDVLNEPTETLPLTIGGVTGTGSIIDNDGAPSLSIDSISVNESAGTATFTVTLSAASGQAISVDYASVNGSATAGSDYAAVSGTLNFAAGETSKTITVSITDDNLFEGSENFTITLSNPSNAVLGTAVGTGTIVDNDAAPTVSSVSSPSVTEGGDLVYGVVLSNPSTVVTSLAYSLGGGSAVAADIGIPSFSDGVTLVGGNLLIPVGVTSFTVTVPTVDDVLNEPTETLPLTVGGVTGTGSIIDNDGAPTVDSVSSPSTTEGGDLVFDVVLSNPSATAIDLAYSLGGGSAVAADYSTVSFSDGVTLAGGILTIPAGVTNFTVTVTTADDALNEPTETLPLSIGGVTGIGSILDNDAAPSLSIDSISVNESAGTATFTVTLSAASGQAISVDYASVNGSATAGSDYAAVSGTLNFAAGETTKTITVSITDDNLFEGSENFTINLSNPSNAVLGTATGTGTIVDNDSAPTVNSISSPSVTEGGDLVYSVALSNPSTVVTSLAYSLGGGSAVAADYSAVSFSDGVTFAGGNLTIPAGVTNFTVTVATVDDALNEPTETLPLTIGGVTGTGSIIDNDGAPSLSIDSISVNESAGTATFTVTLSAASGQAISVDYASVNGSATAGSDYAAVSGTLNFAAGETSKTITVSITDDNLFEGSENFTITLSNPSNAVLGTAVGTGTIVDNDAAPTVSSVSSPSVTEGGDLVYGVVLSNPSTVVTSLAYSLGGGSAVAADIGTPSFSDGVTLVGGNLLIPAGVTSFTVTVPTVDDVLNEPTETLPLTVGGVTGTGSIIDNDTSSNTAPVATNDPTSSGSPYSVALGDASATDLWTTPDSKGQVIALSGYNTSGGSASLYIGTVDGNANVLGVSTSPRANKEVQNQIEYDMASGKSESLLMNFNGNLTQASFSVSRLYPGENGGEVGAWEAYYNGQVVASGYFRLPGTSDKGSFTINTGGIVFNSIRFASLQTIDGTGDGGDYFLTSFQGTGPASVNTSYMVSEGGTKTIGSADSNRLLANDSDADGDLLSVTHINGVAITNGQTLNLADGSSLTIYTDGSFSFATNSAFDYLNAGQVATKSFTYTISDGKGGSDTATATMTVVGVGSPTWLKGTSGNDSLTGTLGSDLIEGGAGNDILLGSLGADTFKWSLADKGTAGAPATDQILDFSRVQGDSINLADLLQGENSGNLTNYMHFTYNASTNQTTLHLSSSGGYSGGYTAASTDQIIIINGLYVSGSDAGIINQLKAAGNLITD